MTLIYTQNVSQKKTNRKIYIYSKADCDSINSETDFFFFKKKTLLQIINLGKMLKNCGPCSELRLLK